ncbi:1-(5-phosphoribosyl)-5-[(5-phosphoribosylamino)methylideneamino]imidazole-4-carboxamide isomerase [Zavarzinella formosa]|uniref:1-(5-phosphoribosyl)-5-[(5- phosphoribosylamino)methylideneamino]imidazole-4- carboxamide isomerase n=1 Tax=Zavarzinella formosa TaxID=360055 RepID=UPI00030A2278|nr:1-(5-phosphoribosyl)-5-[(5-phosphoribosylamino)methylideneamino]imidazole-4-carboxamide isomerase [Zavarzinella formosa]
MLILPAIDLRGGKCVRLKQGDYSQETVFGDDPVAMARRWVSEGAKTLHLVDLDGAKAGHPVNGEVIQQIVQAVDVPCQLGGGLRTEADIQTAFSWGLARVVLGTRALQDPAWVRQMAQTFPNKIILGIDARDGYVATHGWLQTSDLSVLQMAREFANWPLFGIVYTDIAKDGMMGGPNTASLVDLAKAIPIPVIASGGVSNIDDVRELLEHKMFGCIIGRALYEGKIELAAVMELVESFSIA